MATTSINTNKMSEPKELMDKVEKNGEDRQDQNNYKIEKIALKLLSAKVTEISTT